MSNAKWIGGSLIALAALFGGAIVYNNLVINPRVAEELKSNPYGQRAKLAMLLTLPGGKTIPVNYLREDNLVFVGADGPWWRAFKGTGAGVELFIQGRHFTGTGSVILDDIEYVHRVFARLRPKAPTWLPDWLNGKLIVIHLDDASFHFNSKKAQPADR